MCLINHKFSLFGAPPQRWPSAGPHHFFYCMRACRILNIWYNKTAMKQTDTRVPDMLTAQAVRRFRKIILDHYRLCGRDLPWRATADPYLILVSEFMLQQTQVDRVLPKYREFTGRFPDSASLAQAPLQQVLKAWSGLGYNRRAQALHNCAREIMQNHCGRGPDSQEALEQLPGIGPYTARAVCVFAFNQPRIVIETNIRAVYIHFFFPGRSSVQDGDLLPFIEKTLYRRDPRRWYNALMDYGVTLKKTCANPARRSASHVRQSPFKGSNREIRGLIIKTLVARQACSQAMLIKETAKEPERVKAVIRQLTEEGLVKRQGGRIVLP
jgi:A/G-specific adenine glycosylase